MCRALRAAHGEEPERRSSCLALDVRRPVGVEALDRLDAPELAARALFARPNDRLEVWVEDEVPACGHLDSVAARLVSIEEEALRNPVLRGGRLDVDIVVDEEVGRSQAFLASVDPEREVVEPASR